MGKKYKQLQPDDPLLHPDHPRPVSRRDFIRQGIITGGATLATGGIFSLFANPRDAYAELSGDIFNMADEADCPVGGAVSPKLPIICFDLAGGANIAGSNVLVGTNGQEDFLTEAGYSRLGVPNTMLPNIDPTFVNTDLGLAFHSQSAMLAGIRDKAPDLFGSNRVNGIVIPARSDNDTANNPHNPMYGLARAGAVGSVTDLIGSRNSDSGGNSISPVALMNPELRPVKVDRPSDVAGMVDTGDLTAILNDPQDVTAVMESIARLSNKKLGRVQTQVTRDAVIKDLVRCGYLGAADLAFRFAGVSIDPDLDPHIVTQPPPNKPDAPPQPGGVTPIFDRDTEFSQDNEFRKAASVMKMVVDGYAGAGTITMGGYDYHTGDRVTGERRDRRAGRCIGACLDYARRRNSPLIIYVFSDGSVSSNGRGDDAANGKGEWTSDNSSTAASFMLVYNPTATPVLTTPYATTRQIGAFSNNGAVITNSTPAANNVNLLANTLILNYMALNGDAASFPGIFPTGVNHGLGSSYMNYAAFEAL